MPNGELEIYKYLRRGIQDEIMSLKELCKQVGPLIKRAEQADQDSLIFYTRAAGSILHDFYTGVERIFQEIAKKLHLLTGRTERNGGAVESEQNMVQLEIFFAYTLANPKSSVGLVDVFVNKPIDYNNIGANVSGLVMVIECSSLKIQALK